MGTVVFIGLLVIAVVLFLAKKWISDQTLQRLANAAAVVALIAAAIVFVIPAASPQPIPTNTPIPKPTETPISTPTNTPAPSPRSAPDILFEDDFDTGITPGKLEPGAWRGWNLRESGQADWEVRERTPGNLMLCVVGNDGYAVVPSAWQDYALELDIQVVSFSDGGGVNIQVRDQEEKAAYELRIEEEETSLWRQHGNFLAKTITSLNAGKWHPLRFETRGAHLAVFLDSISILEAQDESLTEGGIRLGARGGGDVCFDNVRVTSMSDWHETPTLSSVPSDTLIPTDTKLSTVPLDIVLLLDGSRSMNDDELMEDTIRPFVRSVFGELQRLQQDHRIAVAMFDDSASLIYPLTRDYSVADIVLQNVWGGGGNKLHLGLQVAYAELAENGRSEAEKVVIVVSDGLQPYDESDERPYNPSEPGSTLQVAASMKEAGVKVFSVAIPINRITDEDRNLLQQIATDNQSLLEASTLGDLINTFVSILNE